MTEQWSEEQRDLRDSAAKFATEQLNNDLATRDANATFPAEEWAKCAAFGIQGLATPQEFGGTDTDPVTFALVLEALGYGCRDNGLLFSLGAQMWSCTVPLVRFGSQEQKERYLPGLCDGSLIGVQAMTEPGSGSDAFSLTTSARRTDDGWVLDGSKAFITNAPVADVFVVFASTDPGKGFAGVSAFLVDRTAAGVSVGPPLAKMGLHTSPNAEVWLTDCAVPDDAILGSPGHGFAIFTTSMNWERSFILAPAVGTMQRQIERCTEYARERKQFGQEIGKFQAVANRIVEMKVRLETSRLILYDVARRKAAGQSTALESSMTKLHLSESFLASSLDAVQIHGGYGYAAELEFERDVRDAVASRIYSGTSEIQRDLIARRLGL